MEVISKTAELTRLLDIINAIRFTSNANQYPVSPETEQRLNGPNCDEQIINVVRVFHEQTTWKKCEVRIFPLQLAIASNDNPPEDPFEPQLVGFEGTQSFSLDPIASLLATRGSRGEIALSRADLELCGTKLPGRNATAIQVVRSDSYEMIFAP